MVLQDGVILLGHADFFFEGRGNFQYIGKARINNNQVKLSDLFLEFRRQGLHQGVQIGKLATGGIGNHIGLARMVVDSKLIILDQLEPSSMSKV